MTPLYDVLSAYPILGKGANQLARQKVKMAMAVIGANRHYKWADILPRHWLSTAAAVGLDTTAEDFQAMAGQAPDVVERVSRMLPEGFPSGVADPIFTGLLKAAERLSTIA